MIIAILALSVGLISYLIFRKPKAVGYTYMTLVAIVIVVLATGFIARESVREGKINIWIALVLNFILPPNDFYAGNTESIKNGKSNYVIKFNTKYPGNYNVDLDSIFLPKYDASNFEQFKLNVEILSDSKSIFSRNAEIGYPFWHMDHGSGTTYMTIKSPENIPLGKELTARITIDGNFDSIIKANPRACISIHKGSDE
jgi:hypothetical protein